MSTTPDPAVLARISISVAEIFQEVQISATNHQRNCVKLFKVHDDAQRVLKEMAPGKSRLSGGHAFQEAFFKCLCTTLVQDEKKTSGRVKLVAQFTGAYFGFVNKRASEKYAAQVEAGEIDETSQESVAQAEGPIPGFNFTTYMLKKFVLEGIKAENDQVRERVLLFFSKMVRSLGALSPHHYEDLKKDLMNEFKSSDSRCSRAPVVTCLACLSTVTKGSDSSIQRILLAILNPGEPKEVLKAALSDIYVSSDVIPYVVGLSRHADASTRKLVYAALARQLFEEDEEGGGVERGPTHPRNLSIGAIETLLLSGLQDKEVTVKESAMTLVWAWIKALNEGDHDSSRPVEEGVFSLLDLFKLHKPGSQHRMKAVEILLVAVFEAREDITHKYNFEEHDYWKSVDVEKMVFSRVLVDFLGKSDKERLKDILPLTNNMADHIGHLLQRVVAIYDDYSNGDGSTDEDECDKQETILVEVLKLSSTLDYNDSTSGNNRMALVAEGVLREHRLPLDVLAPCIDILLRAKSDPNRKELVNKIAGIASDLRAWASQTPEDQERLEGVYGRSTKMFTLVLREVNKICDSEQDRALDYVFNGFVRPNTVRMHSAGIMRDALECEGLLAMIKRDIASKVFHRHWTMLEHAGAQMTAEIKAVLYKTVFDLLLIHGPRLFKLEPNDPLQWGPVIEALSNRLRLADTTGDPENLSVLCHGWMKMILEDHVGDRPELEDSVMLELSRIWVSPTSRELSGLQHTIEEFFKGCGCMSARTQKIVQRLFVPAFKEAVALRCQPGQNAEAVRGSVKICNGFLEWTDPLKLERALQETKGQTNEVDHSVQLDLACEIVMALFERDPNDPKLKTKDKQELYKFLQKLHTPDTPNEIRVGDLKLLVDRLKQYRPPTDKPSQKALREFEGALVQRYRTQLDSLSEEDHRKLEESKRTFDFLDDIFSEDDSTISRVFRGPETRSRKRRSLATASSSQDEAAPPVSKRARTSTSTGTGLEEDEEGVDAEISRLLSHGVHLSAATSSSGAGDMTQDSLFSDSEDEEAEVNGLLAE